LKRELPDAFGRWSTMEVVFLPFSLPKGGGFSFSSGRAFLPSRFSFEASFRTEAGHCHACLCLRGRGPFSLSPFSPLVFFVFFLDVLAAFFLTSRLKFLFLPPALPFLGIQAERPSGAYSTSPPVSCGPSSPASNPFHFLLFRRPGAPRCCLIFF